MTTEEKIRVMQAAVDGKRIQLRRNGVGTWIDVCSSGDLHWDWHNMDYRVTPEPKLRPFTKEELLKILELHDRWFVSKDSGNMVRILSIQKRPNGTYVELGDDGYVSLEGLLECFTFENGEPCGVYE